MIAGLLIGVLVLALIWLVINGGAPATPRGIEYRPGGGWRSR